MAKRVDSSFYLERIAEEKTAISLLLESFHANSL
jgi:hypothetical protein